MGFSIFYNLCKVVLLSFVVRIDLQKYVFSFIFFWISILRWLSYFFKGSSSSSHSQNPFDVVNSFLIRGSSLGLYFVYIVLRYYSLMALQEGSSWTLFQYMEDLFHLTFKTGINIRRILACLLIHILVVHFSIIFSFLSSFVYFWLFPISRSSFQVYFLI